jgi:uncharacterized protein (TIGR03435 family)
MNFRVCCVLAAGMTAGLITLGHAQERYAQQPARLTFEVFTIKPADPNARGGGIKPDPGGQTYEASGVPVKLIIALMYKVPQRQITGGPAWLDSDRFDIKAKAAHPSSLDDLHVMFQNLLADEFKLKFHKETREGPVYALVVDKSGSKMKVNQSETDYNKFTINAGAKPGEIVGLREDMIHFAWWLSQIVARDGRPVIDKTGLTGFYDFNLAFSPELPPGVDPEKLPPGLMDNPPIFVALKEQLGLRLEAQKGPVEFYVIDHAEKPADN